MALARVTTWVAGNTLTAAALNGEFNNILNNPITLISPTTGVIDFDLRAHTNMLPSVISASSGSAGQLAMASTAATSRLSLSTGVVFQSSQNHVAAARFSNQYNAAAMTSSGFVLTTGWGSTAVLSLIRGTDQSYHFAVVAGNPTAANPSVTMDFRDGNWSGIPITLVNLSSFSANPGTFNIAINNTSSGNQFQTFFSPSATATYGFDVFNMF